VDLAELIGLRPLPGAGVLLTLTQRCPMRCAHCSTAATMAGAEPDRAALLRFVGSFDAGNRPEVMMLTGGEPLLRPELVADLAAVARHAGTRSAVLTGAFFARRPRPPAPIRRAAEAVDHFSVSIDAFHEREISRPCVFRLLRWLLDTGVQVSLHAVGTGAEDPYLADLTADVRRVFGELMPVLVNTIRPVGRAMAWAAARDQRERSERIKQSTDSRRVLPCAMAAWPVVAHDGTVVACCNQDTVDRRPVPAHLLLGHITTDAWADVRQRSLTAPVLRMIRATGPAYLLARYGGTAGAGHGYCAGCRRLGEWPAVTAAAERIAHGVAGELLDRHAARVQVDAGPVAFVRRHGCAAYADLLDPPAVPALVEAGR
jgi:pyruvate-formate lyase-activating enzyme